MPPEGAAGALTSPGNQVPSRGRADRVKPLIREWPVRPDRTTCVRSARPLRLTASCGGSQLPGVDHGQKHEPRGVEEEQSVGD